MDKRIDVVKYNREAWDRLVGSGNRWTVPVSSEEILLARSGDWQVVLTPQKQVPDHWLGCISGKDVLGLACGGGQQCPLFAAAGARVTVFDNSPSQLQQDRFVADRDGLELRCVQGDMADLSVFDDESFDLIFHPCSNGFVPDVNPVWREASRILRPGGRLLSGFVNPVLYMFDYQQMQSGNFLVKYKIPYADTNQLEPSKLQAMLEQGEPLEFGHSLEDQIGGQLRAGLHLIDFYEDVWEGQAGSLLSQYISPFAATLAIKPKTAAARGTPVET